MNKHYFYEQTVQNPPETISLIRKICSEVGQGTYLNLREDFCGTGKISCEWVKSKPEAKATGIDLSAEVLGQAMDRHVSKLTENQRSRIRFLEGDVVNGSNASGSTFDVIHAGNFSYNCLKSRKVLSEYFLNAKRSLRDPGGIFILEGAGGPGFCTEDKEISDVEMGNGHTIEYCWHQKRYSQSTGELLAAIHFKMPDGKVMKNAFVYDWRVWTVPELRELMLEVGFSGVELYLDQFGPNDEELGYIRADEIPNDYESYLYCLVGIV